MTEADSRSALPAAIDAWRDALGVAHVDTGEASRGAAETATFATAARIPAILHPADRREVQACLRIAGRFGVAVYPISAGRNWGYGSRVPPGDGCVILSLDRLCRIVDFDAELAFITVEPGVTFGQVQRFLAERGAELMLAAPGSTPDASIIGNVVERGIGGGLDGDRARQVCGLEVVLPNGEVIDTGFARFPDATAAPISAHGIGPSLDGLFGQSNFGIVTRLTLWLVPRPPFRQYLSFAINDAARLPRWIDLLRHIKRDGLIDTNIALYNAPKILTYFDRGAKAGLGGGAWFGEGAITAPNAAIGAAKRDLLHARLRGEVDQIFFHEAGGANPLMDDDAPTGLASVYHRKDAAAPITGDPDRDRCGLLWVCPLVPFSGAPLTRCLALIDAVMVEFGFDPIIGVQCHSFRAAHVVASILYDRDQSGADDRARACHDRLLAALLGEGFVPYRLATPAMPAAAAPPGPYRNLLAGLKAMLDPAAILAPGRYDVGHG